MFKAFARALRMAVRRSAHPRPSTRATGRTSARRSVSDALGRHARHASARPVRLDAMTTSPSSTTEWATCARWRRRSSTSRPSAAIDRERRPDGDPDAGRVVLPGPERDARLHAQPRRERPAPAVVVDSARTRPFLGICLGLQMLFDASEEGPTPGSGVLAGRRRAVSRRGDDVARRAAAQGAAHGLEPGAPDAARIRCGRAFPDGARFYFAHSYPSGPGRSCGNRRHSRLSDAVYLRDRTG